MVIEYQITIPRSILPLGCSQIFMFYLYSYSFLPGWFRGEPETEEQLAYEADDSAAGVEAPCKSNNKRSSVFSPVIIGMKQLSAVHL